MRWQESNLLPHAPQACAAALTGSNPSLEFGTSGTNRLSAAPQRMLSPQTLGDFIETKSGLRHCPCSGPRASCPLEVGGVPTHEPAGRGRPSVDWPAPP